MQEGKLYFCQYCGMRVTYESTPTRGAWYARNGRVCGKTDEGMVFIHSPFFDLDTHEYIAFDNQEQFDAFWAEATRKPDWHRDAL